MAIIMKRYSAKVEALVASVQKLGDMTRKAALELTFPISNSDLNPGLLTDITTSAKVERGLFVFISFLADIIINRSFCFA